MSILSAIDWAPAVISLTLWIVWMWFVLGVVFCVAMWRNNNKRNKQRVNRCPECDSQVDARGRCKSQCNRRSL